MQAAEHTGCNEVGCTEGRRRPPRDQLFGGIGTPIKGDRTGQHQVRIERDTSRVKGKPVTRKALLDDPSIADCAGDKRDAPVPMGNKVFRGAARGLIVSDPQMMHVVVGQVGIDEQGRKVALAQAFEQAFAIDAYRDQRIHIPLRQDVDFIGRLAKTGQHHEIAARAQSAFYAGDHLRIKGIVEQQLVLVFSKGNHNPYEPRCLRGERSGGEVRLVAQRPNRFIDAFDCVRRRLGSARVDDV